MTVLQNAFCPIPTKICSPNVFPAEIDVILPETSKIQVILNRIMEG